MTREPKLGNYCLDFSHQVNDVIQDQAPCVFLSQLLSRGPFILMLGALLSRAAHPSSRLHHHSGRVNREGLTLKTKQSICTNPSGL